MMNVVVLFLVLSSLTTVTVWSTPPETLETERKKAREEDAIVKEGRPLTVVEYEKEIPLHPKVSISPQESDLTHKLPGETRAAKEKAKEAASDQNIGDKLSDVAMAAKEKAKEAASVLPNLGQGLSTPTQSPPPAPPTPPDSHRTTRREFICDNLGKCKNKIVGVLGEAKDKAQGGAEQAKEKAKDLAGKVKQAEEIAEDVPEKVKTSAHHLKEMWAVLMGVVRLIGFATAYGTCVWVTFVSGDVLSRALPRQQFWIVQSKMYPVYFKTMAYSIGLSLVGLWLNPESRRSESIQRNNLLASLVMVLVNLLFLEPRATKVMFERMKMEKEEGRGRDDADIVTDTPMPPSHIGVSGAATAATANEKGGARTLKEEENLKVKCRLGLQNQRLKRFNTQSSFLNVLTLMDLTWHLVDLGQRLHLSC